MLVDLTARDENLTGRDAETWLENAGIICNKNGIPDDQRKPMVTSGVRLGTPATTTRGFGPDEMKQIAAWIDRVLGSGIAGEEELAETTRLVRGEVQNLCERFPMPGAAPAAV
jgi:glycine hydroxymethyltransferase